MKEMIKGTVAMMVFVVLFWACEGIYGVSIGSNDALTRSFMSAVSTMIKD